MKEIILIFIASICIFYISSCTNDPCSILNPDRCQAVYNFEFDYKTIPLVDTISIGDTFYLELKVPHIAEDTETGAKYDVSELPFDLFLSPLKFNVETKELIPSYAGDFEYFPLPNETIIIPQLAGVSELVTFDFVDKGQYRIATFGIIPKIKGNFIGFPSFDRFRQSEYNDYDSFSLTDTCCQQTVFTELLYNNGVGSNIELLGNDRSYYYINSDIEYNFGDELYTVYDPFVFYVKE